MCLMQEDAAPVGKGWSQSGRAQDEGDITDASLAAQGHQTIAEQFGGEFSVSYDEIEIIGRVAVCDT